MTTTDSSGRRRGSGHVDLTLTGVLGGKPVALLSVPGDAVELDRLRDQLRRDRATPHPVRSVLGRPAADGQQHTLQTLLDAGIVHGHAPDIVLTLLARAQRVVRLPDGSWWMLGVLETVSPAEAGAPVRLVGWGRLRLDATVNTADELLSEIDFYQLPAGVDQIRDELVLIAVESGWKPVATEDAHVLLLLGPEAAAYLDMDIDELEGRAAVDGVHLTVLQVPRDSSSRLWVSIRDRALELEGPVFSAIAPHEQSGQRLLEAIKVRGSRQLTVLASPGPVGWTLETMVHLLQRANLLPHDRGSRHESTPVPVPMSLPIRTESKEIYLAKTGAARNFDVLVETGHRCHHNAWSRIRHRGAPKKYNGLQRYVRKLDPPGTLIKAELCTYSGCGLIWMRYEINVPADPAGSAESTDSAADSAHLVRGPPASRTATAPSRTVATPSARRTRTLRSICHQRLNSRRPMACTRTTMAFQNNRYSSLSIPRS